MSKHKGSINIKGNEVSFLKTQRSNQMAKNKRSEKKAVTFRSTV